MRKKAYWNYFKYICEHKKNVFIECWDKGLFWHGISHDLSKFRPSEFIPYARYFHIDRNNSKYKEGFEKAWKKHYSRNLHHWNYWYERDIPMPYKYIMQMICDWSAMSRKFGDTPQAFYLNNYKKIKLDRESRRTLEINLGLAYTGQDVQMRYSTVEEIIMNILKFKEEHPESYNGVLEKEYLPEIKEKYGVDMLGVLGLNTSDATE